ncbi:MAG: hypothetical protein ACI3ZT_07955 [Candidatus Cryptobacteroides sp.]
MANNIIYKILICLAAVLVPIIVPAAGLPTLPAAPQVKTGALDNGITYYLVTNPTEKGRADISLVQKGGYDDENAVTRGSSAVNAMGSLASLPHFAAYTPYKFLSRNCIWPGPDGYVSVSEDATVYRFSKLELSRSKEMVDSVMLMIFDIIATQTYTYGGRYVPQNQAIIISGDIDAAAVLNKMNMLSLLVTKGGKSPLVQKYEWAGTQTAGYRHVQDGDSGIVWLTAEYDSPRTPRANMPTVQPLVSQKFASEFGIILKKRLRNAMRAAGVPVADIAYSYLNSAEVPGDEKYRITVGTSPEYLDKAVRVLSSTLAGLDENGSVVEEYRDAQNELMMDLRRDFTGDVVDNSRYVDMCISSFLYGSTLASSKTRMDFFVTKNIQDDISVRLFNNFVFALLDKSRNLTLECRGDSSVVSEAAVMDAFSSSWKPAGNAQYAISRSDTLKFKKNSSKVKLKLSAAEPLSGGQLWTFDNGMRVIYKSVPNTGTFRYMWLLKGGYSLVQGLKPGEGAYISDMLGLYDVSGMDCQSFADMLAANGIAMDCEVTISDMRIGGAAPSSRLQLLLRSLQSLANDRSINKGAYEYYRKCQEVRMAGHRPGEAVLDSLIFPDNLYSGYRRRVNLSDDFQKRTEKYFESEFSKMNDGILLLVGDFDEFELKKMLSRELGGFRTDKVSMLRSRVQPQVLSGKNTKIVDGQNARALMGFSAPVMFTSSSYMSSCIAAMALEDRLSRTLASYGWHGTFRWEFDSFPEERFSFYLDAAPSVRTGVSAALVPCDSVDEVMAGIRKSISAFASAGLDKSELAVYKASLSKLFDSRMAGPETVMSMLTMRYSSGKDLVTKYAEKINTVTAASVGEIVKALAGGRRGEYGVRAPKKPLVEAVQKIPEIPMENMRPQPAADSVGVNRAAYRAVGLDKSNEPYWADIQNFRALALTLPEPAVYVPVPKVDADSISADCDMLIEEIGNSVPDFEPVDDSVLVEKIPEDEIFKLKLRTLDEQK